MSQKTFILIIILSFFIYPKTSKAETNNNIIITEIAAYETSNYEWLEIYNKGTESIDITGWKFYENNTNHGLNAFQGDLIIEPQEYVIIADVAENFKQIYPDFNGTILDSSWTSLKESGEEIGLKDDQANIVELFTYLPCPDTSLQKINLDLNDYTETNWQEHPDSNSAGQLNQFDNNNPEPEPDPDPDTDNPPPVINQRIVTGSIVINEFISDPVSGEPEWIELYNKNNKEIDLKDWQILDGSETATKLDLKIKPNSFLVIENPKGKLNNSGDAIILKDSSGNTIDLVTYGEQETNAPIAQDPYSIARQTDGYDTDIDFADFKLTTTPTKGTSNIITPIPVQDKPYEKEDEERKEETKIKIDYKKAFIINEIYPNPPGNDLDYEFIEIKNISEQDLDLKNWQIQDYSKHYYKFQSSILIKPNQYFTIQRLTSGLALDNDKETLKLIAPNKKTIQSIKYTEEINLTETNSYALNSKNEWEWTTTPTLNKDNVITQLNHPPIIEIYCPKKAITNQTITCDASDSYDLENDQLNFNWIINEEIINNVILKYQFQEKNNHEIKLIVSDSKAESIKIHKIKISAEKKETTKEKIVLKNEELTEVTLTDVRLLEKNTKLKTRGIVSVPPNIFGKTIMYVSGSGIQLYMHKSDWPKLQTGDLIEIFGTLTESKGESRIKIAAKENIIILGNQGAPEARQIKINQINESVEGYLVQITGQLIEKKGARFYLNDETGEAEVYIKTNTKIKKTNYLEGDNLTITGIVSQDNDTYRILPRSNNDIIKNEIINKDKQLLVNQKNKNQDILQYLIASAIFLVLGIATVFYKKKKLSH